MKTFTDNAGRTWSISINATTIKRAQKLTGVAIHELVNDRFKGLAKLISDPVLLCDVAYALAKDEADKLNISDEDFGRAFAGDCLEGMANAFLQELVVYTPRAEVREGLKRVIDASREIQERMGEELIARLEAFDVDAAFSELTGVSAASPATEEGTN